MTQVEDSGHQIMQERCGKVTVSCRKTQEIAGTWKQYSARKLSRFFPVDSCQLPLLSGSKQLEIIDKNSKNFWPEYCFYKITGITRNRPFPCRTVRPWEDKIKTITITSTRKTVNVVKNYPFCYSCWAGRRSRFKEVTWKHIYSNHNALTIFHLFQKINWQIARTKIEGKFFDLFIVQFILLQQTFTFLNRNIQTLNFIFISRNLNKRNI